MFWTLCDRVNTQAPLNTQVPILVPSRLPLAYIRGTCFVEYEVLARILSHNRSAVSLKLN
jgi:hypothetical protein